MPKARNPHGLSGKHGDLTFYTRRGKTYYRKNTILDEEKVKNDPAFENSRKRKTVIAIPVFKSKVG